MVDPWILKFIFALLGYGVLLTGGSAIYQLRKGKRQSAIFFLSCSSLLALGLWLFRF